MAKKKKRFDGKFTGFEEIPPDFFTKLTNLPEDKVKELLKRIAKGTFEIEEDVMNEAYKEGIITEEEYKKKYRHKYISGEEFKSDSFPEFIMSVIFNKRNPEDKMVFITNNDKLLKDRKKLTKRFDIKIMNPIEAMEEIEELENGELEVIDAM
jgi:hypothetical protein